MFQLLHTVSGAHLSDQLAKRDLPHTSITLGMYMWLKDIELNNHYS